MKWPGTVPCDCLTGLWQRRRRSQKRERPPWATPVNLVGDREHYRQDSGAHSVGSTRMGGNILRRLLDAGWISSRRCDSHGGTDIGGRRQFPHSIEQLVASPGSLPDPLSREARERLLNEVAPTATFEMLSKVPRNLLTAEGPQGQQLRRKMLHGAVIVFISAGYEGKRFVYERARELGVKGVMIDNPDSWSRNLVDEGLLTKFIPVDMSQPSDTVFRDALAAIQQLRSDPSVGRVSGIATVVELSVCLAARLAESLGLPGHLPAAVDCARDKKCTREALSRNGLPTPAHYCISSEEDLGDAARVVGFPAVLKPISGAASLGVKKVSSEAALWDTYKDVAQEFASLVVCNGALVKASGACEGISADKVINTCFLLEQYLDGEEVDVDVVMSDGEWRYAAVTDNGPTLEPYFPETWGVLPSLLPREQQVALRDLAVNSLQVMGFTDGVFHVECKYTSKGPQLIEVNARMGGGPVFQINLKTWGVDLVEETLFCAVGITARPVAPSQPLACIAVANVNSLQSGTLRDMSFLEAVQGRDGVISVHPHVRVGDRIVGPEEGMPSWLVEVFVSKPTAEEAREFVLSLEAEVQANVVVA